MKKWYWIPVLFLCLFWGTVPVFAGSQKVFDYANVLTEQEEQELQEAAEAIVQEEELDLVFLTIEDTQGLSVREYGANFYIQQALGVGADDSGVIFVVDMTTREAQIVTCGKAVTIFTDYYIDKIWKDIQVDFADGDYFWGMKTLANRVAFYATEYQKYITDPKAVSEYEAETSTTLFLLGGAAVFSLLVAAISISCMKKAARNVQPYSNGMAYLKQNSVLFSTNKDIFTDTHTSMVPLPKQEDSGRGGDSWGGGSDTFQSGGKTFGGGGGRF